MSERESEETGERPYEATPRRLEEARRRGDIPNSADLTTAAGYCGLALAAGLFGSGLAEAGGTLAGMLALAGPAGQDGLVGLPDLGRMIGQALLPLAPFVILPAALSLAAILAQNAFVVAPDRITPKLSKLFPLAGLKRRFGADGWFDFAKGLVKLGLMSLVLFWALLAAAAEIIGLTAADPRLSAVAPLTWTAAQTGPVAALALALALPDLLWQRASHARRNRMTRQELLDELKESEGDPGIKQQRRQRAVAIATNRMLSDVSRADVVIVNPTHFAVALAWDRSGKAAPVCVAKGTDAVALRIRAVAIEAGVPVRSDPPTARQLHAEVEIGAPIEERHFRAVAAAIRFADRVGPTCRRLAIGRHALRGRDVMSHARSLGALRRVLDLRADLAEAELGRIGARRRAIEAQLAELGQRLAGAAPPVDAAALEADLRWRRWVDGQRERLAAELARVRGEELAAAERLAGDLGRREGLLRVIGQARQEAIARARRRGLEA